MKIRTMPAETAAIPAIAARLQQLERQSGVTHLHLNRGINAVEPIDISTIWNMLDLSSPAVLNYPPAGGLPILQASINKYYFNNKLSEKQILITGGATMALNLCLAALEPNTLWLPHYFWGTYSGIAIRHNHQTASYSQLSELTLSQTQKKLVLVCDPGNPLGEKADDESLIRQIQRLSDAGATILIDSPYRALFSAFGSDSFYSRLVEIPNTILIDSFSKSIGLSGFRLGFLYSAQTELIREIHKRLVFETNGISSVSQLLIAKLLDTPQGQHAIAQFKTNTTRAIGKNIEYLASRNLLANQLYQQSQARGIFVAVRLSEEELLKYHIGSVSLAHFVLAPTETEAGMARISVSVPHQRFVEYFSHIPLH